MANNFFSDRGITATLKNLRHLVSCFPKHVGSVSVISPHRIQSQWMLWSRELPSISPFYAVKCNPEPVLLQTLANHLVNFDCASIREISEVSKIHRQRDDAQPEIIYAHPMKSDKDIRIVDRLGIKTTVVDSIEECDKLTSSKWQGSAFVRIAVGDKGSKMPFSAKFGASRPDIEEIARFSRVPITGISFHVGSGCKNPSQYTDAIKYAMGPILNTLIRNKHNVNTLDIGGGFSAQSEEFKESAKAIREGLKSVPENLRVIAEPGRFFAQPCQDLFVKVIAKKRGLDGTGWRYIIDESLYGYFSCIPFDHQTPAWFRIPKHPDEGTRQKEPGVLFGRTCDSLDVIAKGPMERLEVGDWLYFPFMGAYTNSTASEFNGFPKPHLFHDNTKQIPDTATALELYKQFHTENTLTYSRALESI